MGQIKILVLTKNVSRISLYILVLFENFFNKSFLNRDRVLLWERWMDCWKRKALWKKKITQTFFYVLNYDSAIKLVPTSWSHRFLYFLLSTWRPTMVEYYEIHKRSRRTCYQPTFKGMLDKFVMSCRCFILLTNDFVEGDSSRHRLHRGLFNNWGNVKTISNILRCSFEY